MMGITRSQMIFWFFLNKTWTLKPKLLTPTLTSQTPNILQVFWNLIEKWTSAACKSHTVSHLDFNLEPFWLLSFPLWGDAGMFEMLLKVYCAQLSLPDISLSILAQEKSFLSYSFCSCRSNCSCQWQCHKEVLLISLFQRTSKSCSCKTGKGLQGVLSNQNVYPQGGSSKDSQNFVSAFFFGGVHTSHVVQVSSINSITSCCHILTYSFTCCFWICTSVAINNE